jgi:hypothetical protein
MRARKWLILFLAGLLLLSPLSASPLPGPSSSGVWLSDEEVAEMEAAILEAQAALDKSSELIAKQEKDYKRLLTLCVVLGIALTANGIATIILVSR